MPDFLGSYHQHFDVVRADTPTLLDLCYRLRYQVYCLENSFEDPARYPNKREIDDDDDRSVHTLLIHRATGAAAGTARLILPRPDAGRALPIQKKLAFRGNRAVSRISAPSDCGNLAVRHLQGISPPAHRRAIWRYRLPISTRKPGLIRAAADTAHHLWPYAGST